jgi:translation initiation factor 5A
MEDEYSIDSIESGTSLTTPQQAGTIHKGDYIMIKGCPCKVSDVSTSKTGKHGHAKAHFVAIDIFTGKKLEELCPTSHNIDVPVIKRMDYTLMDIQEDDYVSLMDESSNIRDDIKLPDDNGNEIQKIFENGLEIMVTVLSAMNKEKIVSYKTI